MKRSVLLLLVVLCAFGAAAAHAAPPPLEIPFSKRVSLRLGRSYLFRFSLHASETGGTALWSEQERILLRSAKLSHRLGSVDPVYHPLDPGLFAQQLWVEVGRMSPVGVWRAVGDRTKLHAVPYALWSHESPGSGGGDITAVLSGSGLSGGGLAGDVTLSASFVAAGGSNGVATSVARGDHRHDALYVSSGGGTLSGPLSAPSVGVGIAAPAKKVHIQESVAGLSFALKLDNQSSVIGGHGTGILFSGGGSGATRGKAALAFETTGSWNRGKLHVLQNNVADESGPTLADAVLTVQSNGYVGLGTPNPGARLDVAGTVRTTRLELMSDERLKGDVAAIDRPLEKIAALRGVEYRWRGAGDPAGPFPGGRQIGFLAQEVERVLPEVVSTEPGGGLKSVQYTGIVPVLVEAVKALREENEALRARLAALEARL